MQFPFIKSALALAIAVTATGAVASSLDKHDRAKSVHKKETYFERVSTFPVYQNLAPDENTTDATAAEISAASHDGKVVYYSNSPRGRIGMIDIADPAAPVAAGFLPLAGEPTSVAVTGDYLLVAVNTSSSYTTPGGVLSVYSIDNPLQPQWVADLDMGGQPDAIAISPDGRYAAVVIENERDEDFDDGLIPQQPAGYLKIITTKGKPSKWKVRQVELTGYAEIAPDDPEPEYVAISRLNIAAVSLQENNHLILVDLRRGMVINEFSAGSVDLFGVDTQENDVIEPLDNILNRRREPDSVAWLNDWWVVTANEGDYEDADGVEGGSRGFTIFSPFGHARYESGSSMEHDFIRIGHYPESRSENKGIEPESVTTGHYGKADYLFVGAERGNAVAVYKVAAFAKPKLHQILPSTIGPEGILTIPSRNLVVVSSEEDSADDGFRSTVSIYQYGAKAANYPEIMSDPKQLIPWSALSGMVADNHKANILYAVPDSYYAQSRIFKVKVAKNGPAIIKEALVLSKDGDTVDYDLEGIAQRSDGSFWLVSEGNGGSRPNLLIKTAADGTVMEEINLPDGVIDKQISNGFEGVAVTGSGENERVLVAFQREWKGDPENHVRIGVYNPSNNHWGFLYYPLDVAQEDAWVGLSELSAIDDHNFVVIERDNQQGDKAQLKRLYRFSIDGLTPAAEGGSFPVVSKTVVHDLLPDLKATGGWVLDKVEGTAITKKGEVYVVTDNDGVDDSSGETRFMHLGKLFR
ncbi:MAG: esterase-like activity of phytase family protein [Ketobacter sp.]